MEYTTNGDLLTIHGKYMHNIFRIPTRHKLENNFSLKIFYNRITTRRPDIPRITDFYSNKYGVSIMTYFV